MTNKEKYKQAFSVLHPSNKISLEVEEMMTRNKARKIKTAVAAAVVCLLMVSGSGMAYAADLGGIQRTLQLWIRGDQTDVTFKYDKNGTYDMSYRGEDGKRAEQSGGGVAIEEDGSTRPLTEEELLEELYSPDVEYREDGTVWLYYYDQKMDITDRFKDGICYVKVTNGEKTLYVTIKYQDGLCASPHRYADPEEFN